MQIRTSVVACDVIPADCFYFRLVQICTSIVAYCAGEIVSAGFRLVQIRTSVVVMEQVYHH